MRGGLPRWSSGYDLALSLQGVWVPSLAREDPVCCLAQSEKKKKRKKKTKKQKKRGNGPCLSSGKEAPYGAKKYINPIYNSLEKK